MPSVHSTNLLSETTIGLGIEAGAVAWAAAALSSPIGAMGGALFGAVRHVSHIGLALGTEKCLNTADPLAATDAKTLAKALTIFGSYALAWGVLAVAGFSLTVSHVVALTLMSIITTIAIDFILQCVTGKGVTLDQAFPSLIVSAEQ